MKKIRSLVPKQEKFMTDIRKELADELKDKMKSKVKTKMKQIRMAEITLEKLNKELQNLISGRRVVTEEELLFDKNDSEL